MPEPQPREQLCKIIERYGLAITQDKKLCKNLLNDLVPEHRLEVHLLVIALEQGIVEQLLNTQSVQVDLQINRLAQHLRDLTGIELELAYWAIESWALASNVIVAPLFKPVNESLPTTTTVPSPSITRQKTYNAYVLLIVGCLAVLLTFSFSHVKRDNKSTKLVTPAPETLEKPVVPLENLPMPSDMEFAEDAWSQNHLGNFYYYGYKVPKNHEKAVYWYRKAAEQGDKVGQCNLAYMYFKGYGVTQNYQLAFDWYQKAAEQGSADGQNNLAIMYEYGYGIPINKQLAIAWYSKAVEQGHYGAQLKLRELLLK